MSPVSRSVSRPVSRSILAGQSNTLASIIKPLFANNEQGFAYDPNDLSTMWKDAAGTVPVTGAGQAVGLMLDKKNPALVGGEVSVDITNWVNSGTIIKEDKQTFSNQSAATGLFYDGAAIDGLKVVELHYTVTGGTVQICDALGVRVRAESTQPSGVLKATFYPARDSSPLGRIYFRLPTAGTTLVINKLIVHTYVGNHAYQTNSASRPILRQNVTTGAYYLEFDGVDDNLMLGPISLPVPFSHVTALEDRKQVNTQAIFSGGTSGYLTFVGGTNLGIQQNSGNPTMYTLRGNKEVITHIANNVEVTLKSNLSAATRSDIVHTNPYTGVVKKYIGAFNDTQFSTAARIDYYGSVFIKETINSVAEEEIRAHFNKRIGV